MTLSTFPNIEFILKSKVLLGILHKTEKSEFLQARYLINYNNHTSSSTSLTGETGTSGLLLTAIGVGDGFGVEDFNRLIFCSSSGNSRELQITS